MSKEQKTHILFIDSDLRETGSSYDFSYVLNIPKDCTKVSVVQASIPKTYYLVGSGNNTFTVRHGVTSYTVTVPVGNYSMRVFKTVMTALLNALSAFVYTITYPGSAGDMAETGKFIFAVSGNAGVQPVFIFPERSTLYRQMGFNYNSTNAFVGDSLTSTNCLDFTLCSAIYILSDICTPGANQQQSSSVLQEILVQNTQDLSRIGFQNVDPVITAKDLDLDKSVFKFTIVDNDGNILDLNGHQVNFSLLVY